MTDWTRRSFLTVSLASAGQAALALGPQRAVIPARRPDPRGPVPPVPPRRPGFDTIIADARLTGATGVMLGDGPMFQEMADQEFAPASVTKTLTALYALDALGPDHRFTTQVLATGPVEQGVVQGDLILSGGGDPVLDTDGLAALVDQLAIAGITGATGFAVWGGALPYREEIEPLQRDHYAYNPSVSGLNLNFNRVRFEWRRAGGQYDLTLDARTETLRPEVLTSRIRAVERGAPVYVYEGADEWTVARGALGSGGGRWLPVRRPEVYAADLFRTLARAKGITLPNARVLDADPTGTEVARHDSPPLTEIVTGMMEFSTNLTAEVLGLTATKARLGRVVPLAQSAAQMEAWLTERYGPGLRFADHSGLSDRSRVTARALVRVLKQEVNTLIPVMKHIRWRDPVLPQAIRAKTGTLDFVSCLAGYLIPDGGDPMPFAILSGDLERRAEAKRLDQDPPRGADAWNARARIMQDRLLRRATLGL